MRPIRPEVLPDSLKRPQKPRNGPHQGRNRRRNGSDEPLALSLQGSRSADPRNVPHEHAQIVSAGVDQQSVPNVGVAPPVHPPHPAGPVHAGHRLLRLLRPPLAQLPAALPAHPLPVGRDRLFDRFLAVPVCAPSAAAPARATPARPPLSARRCRCPCIEHARQAQRSHGGLVARLGRQAPGKASQHTNFV